MLLHGAGLLHRRQNTVLRSGRFEVLRGSCLRLQPNLLSREVLPVGIYMLFGRNLLSVRTDLLQRKVLSLRADLLQWKMLRFRAGLLQWSLLQPWPDLL